MNILCNNFKKDAIRGFTLIEVIISLAILGIIAVSFLTLFTSSFSTIFSMGHKTDAANEAQAFIETVYLEGIGEIDSVAIKFNSTLETNPSNFNSTLYDTTGPNKQVFHNVDSTGTYPKVTVMILYQNGSRQVMLSALVP